MNNPQQLKERIYALNPNMKELKYFAQKTAQESGYEAKYASNIFSYLLKKHHVDMLLNSRKYVTISKAKKIGRKHSKAYCDKMFNLLFRDC